MDIRRVTRQDGFSLVELLVILLVVGILIAIALPTYLGGRARASDRAAQEHLRHALVGGLTHYAEKRTYAGFTAAVGEGMIPELEWVEAGPPALREVAVSAAAGDELLLISASSSGTYWCLAQIGANPGTLRGGGAAFADVDTVAECTGGW